VVLAGPNEHKTTRLPRADLSSDCDYLAAVLHLEAKAWRVSAFRSLFRATAPVGEGRPLIKTVPWEKTVEDGLKWSDKSRFW